MADPAFKQGYYFNYFEVANDHLVDAGNEFAPRRGMTSDHGMATAHLKKIKPVVVAPDHDEKPTPLVEPMSPADLRVR